MFGENILVSLEFEDGLKSTTLQNTANNAQGATGKWKHALPSRGGGGGTFW